MESIEPAQFETNLDPPIIEAWLAVITRSGEPSRAGGWAHDPR
ncbi:MAG: hypothetical protein ABSA65_20225 [Acidimicrobiales bacterium]